MHTWNINTFLGRAISPVLEIIRFRLHVTYSYNIHGTIVYLPLKTTENMQVNTPPRPMDGLYGIESIDHMKLTMRPSPRPTVNLGHSKTWAWLSVGESCWTWDIFCHVYAHTKTKINNIQWKFQTWFSISFPLWFSGANREFGNEHFGKQTTRGSWVIYWWSWWSLFCKFMNLDTLQGTSPCPTKREVRNIIIFKTVPNRTEYVVGYARRVVGMVTWTTHQYHMSKIMVTYTLEH